MPRRRICSHSRHAGARSAGSLAGRAYPRSRLRRWGTDGTDRRGRRRGSRNRCRARHDRSGADEGWAQQYRRDHRCSEHGSRPPWPRRAPAQVLSVGRGLPQKLEEAHFAVEKIAIIPRPTTLPNGIEPWLDTFAEDFLSALAKPDRWPARAEIADLLRPVLMDKRGAWIVDYVRLRFRAIRAE
jgi:hypothetical protein